MKREFRFDIQGLRALAVMSVIIFHMQSKWLPGGFIGVDVFFVISGYLMTSIITAAVDSRSFSLKEFYAKRIARIVPAYICMIALVALVMGAIQLPRDFGNFRDSLAYATAFLSNIYFASFSDYFTPSYHQLPLLHTWSLAIEMQFYLVLPFFLMFFSRKLVKIFLPLAALALIGIATWHLYTTTDTIAIYYAFFYRIPEFLFGSFLVVYDIGKHWKRQWVKEAVGLAGLILILASCVFLSQETKFPGVACIAPCLGAAMVIAARGGVANRFLSLPVFVIIGNASYSLYLWHWPVFSVVRYCTNQYTLNIYALVASLGVIVLISGISYICIEKRFINKKQSIKITSAKYVSIVLFLFMASFVSLEINKGNEFPPQMSTYASFPICHNQVLDNCSKGDLNSDIDVFVTGDSNAAQLNAFFDVVGSRNNFKATVITTSGYLPLKGADTSGIRDSVRPSYDAQVKRIYERIQSETPDYIVFAGNWSVYFRSSKSKAALGTFLQEMQHKGIPVVIISEIPKYITHPLRIEILRKYGIILDNKRNFKRDRANELLPEFLAPYTNTVLFNFSSLLEPVALYDNGVCQYSDGVHVNEIGSRRLGELAAPFFSLATLFANE